ncbi:MAG: hypothetical protein HFACDABA_02890 [Anaerolineales bacterium]|nr:hypothetical protein [Anaerolineales bacterium]
MNRNQKLALIIIAALAGLWLLREPLTSLWNWIGDREAVAAFTESAGIWGPFVIFVLLILQVFLAIIPGQALMVVCGMLYGFTGGSFLAWISLVTGGQLAFVLARRLGRPFAERWVSPDVLNRWDKSAAQQGAGFFTVSLILPIFPNDAMCYVAGLGAISYRRFLGANMLGRAITCTLTSFLGAYGSSIPPVAIGIGIVSFFLIALVWKFGPRISSWFYKGGSHVIA